MKLIVNETFQHNGVHREGAILTVSQSYLENEIKKGRKKRKKFNRYPWISGIMEHCTAANDKTADFLNEFSDTKVKVKENPAREEDDAEEILDIRAEFDKLGKAYDKRWGIKRLRNEIIKARIEAGERDEQENQRITEIREGFNIGE